MKEFVYSKHSEQRFLKRKIDKSLVELALNKTDSIVNEDGFLVYQKLVKRNSKWFLLLIFVNDEKHPPVIITGYLTSKIQKYHSI